MAQNHPQRPLCVRVGFAIAGAPDGRPGSCPLRVSRSVEEEEQVGREG